MSDLFRKKSMDRVSSPEQLNDYIRVTTPSVWLVMLGVILLLAGMIVWSIFGTVNATDSDGEIQTLHPITFVMN